MNPEEESVVYVPDENGPELPLPPTLPAKPFTHSEVMELMDEVTDHFPNPHDALEELMSCGSSMFEDVEELLEGHLSAEKFTVLMPILIQIAFVFAHPGTLQPELDLDAMEEALEEFLDDGPGDADALISNSKQPELLKLSLQTLQEFNQQTPKGQEKLSSKDMAIVQLLLRVVIDEFDSALRKEGAARD